MHKPLRKLSRDLVESINGTINTILSCHWRTNERALADFRVVTFRKGIFTPVTATVIGLPVGTITRSVRITPVSADYSVGVAGHSTFNGVQAKFDSSTKFGVGSQTSSESVVSLSKKSTVVPTTIFAPVVTGQIVEPFLIQKCVAEGKNVHGTAEEWTDPDDYSDSLATSLLTEEEIKRFWRMISAIVSLGDAGGRFGDNLLPEAALPSSITLLSGQIPFSSPASLATSNSADTSTFSVVRSTSSVNRAKLQIQLLKSIGPNQTVSSLSELGHFLLRKEFRTLRAIPDLHSLVPPALGLFLIAV
jgi:hypothetical protein